MKKRAVSLKINDKCIIIFLNRKIFFYQKIIKSNNIHINNKTYTYIYIYKILYRFGLSGHICKKQGYKI